MKKIVLIDGHSILNRAFFGLPDLTNSEGTHTNAVYGFLNIMLKILEEEKPEELAVAFDVHHPTFRHEMFADYKGTRKPMVPELKEQVPLLKEVLHAMGICTLEAPGYEADDILGTMAKRSEKDGYEVRLVSGDRDMLQLATEHIMILLPRTKQGTTTVDRYDAAAFIKEKGVTPEEFIDVKALMGDSSDNIPGVPHIGEKTAYSLIAQFHSLEGVYENLNGMKAGRARTTLEENRDLAELSRDLARINTAIPIEVTHEDTALGSIFTEEAYPILKRLELKSILSRFPEPKSAPGEKKVTIHATSDLLEAEKILSDAAKAENLGFELVMDGEEILGLSLCTSPEETFFLRPEGFLTAGYLIEAAAGLLNRKKTTAVIHLKELLAVVDGKEDVLQMDLGVCAYLLNPLKSTYEYDDLARDYMGLMLPTMKDLLGKLSLTAFAEKEPERFLQLASDLARVAYGSIAPVKEALLAAGEEQLYQTIELPLIYCLSRMEKAGILVRREELNVYADRLKEGIAALEETIYREAGENFNINSPKQLGVILFEKLGLPSGKKTKTGYSTSADVLEKLAGEYTIVKDILQYRQLSKLHSTYALGLQDYIRPDGRIYGKFNQTITATGRISSTEPNLQNIPVRMELGREIRKVFVPAEGCVFVDADYSQIELRIMAHMSGDEKLCEAYRMGRDIHRTTASQVFHVPFDEVTPQQRRDAKAVNFGIIYGISAFGLSEDLSITRQEANAYINSYFETYPQVKAFIDGLVEKAKTEGFVTTLYGRRRPMPEIQSSNFMQRQFGERIAMNAPIQGTAADLMKLAMIRVDRALAEKNLRSRVVLQVHDELLLEVPNEELEAVMALVREAMEGAAKLNVPLEVDIHSGDSWFETK